MLILYVDIVLSGISLSCGGAVRAGSSTAVMWSDSNNDSKQFLSNASERSLRPVGKSNQSRAEAMNADLDAQIAAIRMGRSPALTQEACELGTAASKSATVRLAIKLPTRMYGLLVFECCFLESGIQLCSSLHNVEFVFCEVCRYFPVERVGIWN